MAFCIRPGISAVLLAGLFAGAGCGQGTSATPAPSSAVSASSTSSQAASEQTAASAPASAAPSTPRPMEMDIPSISLSPVVAAAQAEDAHGNPLSVDQTEQRRILFDTMKPLQIMLGSWNGTTQKEVGDFKALDKSNWVWDLKSDRKQPAMVMTSNANPYFQNARLTYFPNRKLFQMQATDSEGQVRTLEGTFTQAAETFQGDDRQSHIKYKVELTQIDPPNQRDAWQLIFNQQDNNRFLIEVARKRGSRFLRVDTIAAQREGTSFAKSDESYGDRECIISGGLGTISVSFKGTSYWVCCTGCQAAFNEEPERWIAEYKAKKAKAMPTP